MACTTLPPLVVGLGPLDGGLVHPSGKGFPMGSLGAGSRVPQSEKSESLLAYSSIMLLISISHYKALFVLYHIKIFG